MLRETMEQSCRIPVTTEELEVAEALLELLESESRPRFSFAWGAKRRRSAVAKEELAAASFPAVELSPSPAPSPAPPLPSKVVDSTYDYERSTEKRLASSPATPLSFSPSESDEKPLPSKKKSSVNSLKRRREQLLEMVEDYTQRNQLLKKDIESKRLFLDQQKAKNLKLKMKEQELSLSLLKAKEPRREAIKGWNLEIQITQTSTGTENGQDDQSQQQISSRAYQQPFTVDQTVSKNSEYPYGGMISWLPSSTGGFSNVSLGLFDLNVSPEEGFGFCSSTSFDVDSSSKARAAQARFKRMQICRTKNHNAGWKARYR